MNYLAQALEKYYKKQGNKIIFLNGKTLNQLATEMWGKLAFSQIDPSVISRVLRGKRLFTKLQLQAFCECLNLNKRETEHLLLCLTQDYCERYDLDIESVFISRNDLLQPLKESSEKISHAFYNGSYAEVIKMAEIAELYSELTLQQHFTDEDSKYLAQLTGLNLFLKAQASMIFHTASESLTLSWQDSNKMLQLSKTYKDPLFLSYRNIMKAHAYYIAGGYSYSHKKRELYRKAIIFSKKAVDTLPDKEGLKLNALRVMAASASYSQDNETIRYVFETMERILPQQSFANNTYSLQLASTLSKGLACSQYTDPFSIREKTRSFFKSDLTNKGIYELTEMKEEVEALTMLKTKDISYIYQKARKGLAIAKKYDYTRHKKFFTQTIASLG